MPHTLISAVLVCVFSSVVFGQKLSEKETAALLSSLADDEKAVAKCDQEIREEQSKKFAKPAKIVSGHCFSSCPVSLPLPPYPIVAKRYRISGPVRVEAIFDESGKVVLARVLQGNPVFRKNALLAAYRSKYQPKKTCEDRPIKFRWIINYFFRPTM